jgi:hypothetical protein
MSRRDRFLSAKFAVQNSYYRRLLLSQELFLNAARHDLGETIRHICNLNIDRPRIGRFRCPWESLLLVPSDPRISCRFG